MFFLQLPVGGNDTLGRERVKNFTYDYAYWSVDVADGNYAPQEKVISHSSRYKAL